MSEEINWSQDMMLEVTLREPDDFLKVRETLTRVGVASRKERKLYQSCHILHKRGKYCLHSMANLQTSLLMMCSVGIVLQNSSVTGDW